MRSPTYTQKLERAKQQTEAVTKSIGKPDVKFNTYLKQRKAAVKEQIKK